MTISGTDFDVIVAGAGPAGASVAIYLALGGASVMLVERKKFPRAKLCGEFISPECLGHFERLGVADQMVTSGAVALRETVFYSRTGYKVVVPTEWFSGNTTALGLSRAQMDQKLLERARSLGVCVLQETRVSGVLKAGEKVRGVRLQAGPLTKEYTALVTVDATGRARALVRKAGSIRGGPSVRPRPRFVAFKAHLQNSQAARGVCEIYLYKGGYGGLSEIEGGISNLCCIVAAKDVRRCNSDPERVMREVVLTNTRAAETLSQASLISDWLSMTLDNYGRQTLAPRKGLLTVGDAAAFIDPFTGSGMLIALESGELAALTILEYLATGEYKRPFFDLGHEYSRRYQRRFDSRFRISGLLRQAVFVPGLAEVAIRVFSTSKGARRKLARATRWSSGCELGAPGSR